jgi:YfiH family protein
MIVTSSVLANTPHGFTTREGGVSEGRYATLNLGVKWGDDPERVRENRRRVALAGGFALERLFTVRQVHGVGVQVVEAHDEPAQIAEREADALVTRAPGVTIGIFTADCVPILFSDGEGRVGAAHAGWRGTAADVVGRTVERLVALGARPERLRAALGPSICVSCFEVGEEVAERFAKVTPTAVMRGGQRPHVDLWEANRILLLRAGLDSARIDARPECTHCMTDRFFSFRRDGAGIGQQLSYVAGGKAPAPT